MIEERIQNIEAKIQSIESIPAETKAELLAMLGDLKSDVTAIAKPRSEEPERAGETMSELSSSVQVLEAEHPHIVQLVNRLANILSNMGI